MTSVTCSNVKEFPKKYSFDDALDITGFGKYTTAMLVTCCLLIMGMYLDIFGFSVLLPAAACDLALTTVQQGLLTALPLIGVMISSYGWGLCVDTMGRRTTLVVAMPIGIILNLASSIAPNYASLAVLKFLSASFTSSANSAVFVLIGESSPNKHRARFMYLMTSATMVTQLIISACALPILSLTFRVPIPWLGIEYRPWRLLMQIINIPGVLGVVAVLFMHESPKFLLSKGREKDAHHVLKSIYKYNTGLDANSFPVQKIYLEELMASGSETNFLRKMWNQTAPLFKPPLLKNSLKLYYILMCAYMTSTGYTMWVPTMTNAFFNGHDTAGKTLCEVANRAGMISTNKTTTNCDHIIQPLTLYTVMIYSLTPGLLSILMSFFVGPLGKKRSTLLVMSISIVCGLAILFVRVPLLNISLFYMFLYVSLILGNINTYLVELNPTYLRGMATCLSVVVARGFGFFSVQLIGALLADYCTPMISGYVLLVISGLIIALFLPPDTKKHNGISKHDTLREVITPASSADK